MHIATRSLLVSRTCNTKFWWFKVTGWTTGFRFPAGATMGFFSSSPRPGRIWGPPSLLINGYRRFLSSG